MTYFFIGKTPVFLNGVNYSSHLGTLCRLNCFVSFIKSATKSAVSTKKWASTNNKFVAFDVARVSMITSSANWKRDVGSRQARNTCFVVIYCLVFITSQSNLVFLGFISIKRKPWSHLNVVRSRSPNSEIKTLWDNTFTYYLTIHSNFIFFLKKGEKLYFSWNILYHFGAPFVCSRCYSLS